MQQLSSLTSKKHITLVKRGNRAILLALRAAMSKNKTKLLIQDQGGWITYKQYAKKLKLDIIELKTNYGLTDLEDLKKIIDENSILFINSMPGYHALENMKTISIIAKQHNSILINDATGSIGTEQAKYGDIILGSFGEDKPIDIGYGGFLAYNDEYKDFFIEDFDNEFIDKLKNEIKDLPRKLKYWDKINKKIKSELSNYQILNKNKEGINVIVKFNNHHEKEEIINYCKKNNYEYTICPRYIRVNDDAISIELKRCK